ncbi:VanW family protein [Paenibacillus sp. NEAU-GSW1]|uniref:VanW family protein n=1 Tax=Paenibacillus sp. NEAU-GSW1 TaxID=2682486 RepID=UPI0012E1EF05|nr:VanW family protein [Paenibacillus sp. NEAU-GSW1]MUT66445.1 vancomycin resistance protein [Paenibacillus sp. NEAU-GSW1]
MDLLKHRPIKRSKLRLKVGKWWFMGKRYAKWMADTGNSAKTHSSLGLPHTVFRHETPLYRQLRNVDMWLQSNKVINLKLAAERLNGLLLKPGEKFSYWRTIGKPSSRRGYVDGMILYYGTYGVGVGGGLCQMSNLIYWMTLHTPLTVTERHRHSYDVFPDASRTQPFGSGATCAYNYLDLQIVNETTDTYQLNVRVEEEMLVGEWRCSAPSRYRYDVYEKEHRIELRPWGGYIRSNRIHREVYAASGEMLEDQFVASNEAIMMYAPLLPDEQP